MATFYTVEQRDSGLEIRLSRNHSTRCSVWICSDVADRFLASLTSTVEASLREQMRGEYDAVLSRLIALIRAVMDGKPGGSIEVPEECALPFLN